MMEDSGMQETNPDMHNQVRQFYGQLAAKFTPREQRCGCAPGTETIDQVRQMYDAPEVADLPDEITGLALGCGDPVTLARLQPGQTVLDLGSGGGIDCFLAAQRVSETGHVIGVDMTVEMIEKARQNKARLSMQNVEFRLGEIEHLPVADASVDVVISNCVINLSPDKRQVFREAYRVLKPGGQLSISDMMTDGPLPESFRQSAASYAICIGNDLDEEHYLEAIREAGFVDIEISRDYPDDETLEREIKAQAPHNTDGTGRQLVIKAGERIEVMHLSEEDAESMPRSFSGKIRARKPKV